MSLSKPWKEWKKKALYEAFSGEIRLRADYQDALDDVLSGFERWAKVKQSSLEWTDEDEALLRWIERSPAQDLRV